MLSTKLAVAIATPLIALGGAFGVSTLLAPTPQAWVYSCEPYTPNGQTLYPANFDFYPVYYSGSVQGASDWVASHTYPNAGCWNISYIAPSTTTTTDTTLPTTTTTTFPWPPKCKTVCQKNTIIYCSKHPTNHTLRCRPVNGL